jgi:nucleotide-binding universal stress UspA family protein
MSIKINSILCPTDFSESSEYALKYAASFARRYGAVVYLLHVIEPLTPVPGIDMGPTMTYDERPDVAETLKDALKKAIPEHTHVDIRPMIRRGAPFLEIVRAAKEMAVDLIIIATHGRTGLAHVLLGSTAERVVRKAACPVLTVKQHETSENPDQPDA